MRVVMRVDASLQIGSGHVMRCLTLADELRSRGAEVHFVCREHPGHLCALVEERGYPCIGLVAPTSEYHAPVDDPSHAAWLAVPWQQDAEETAAALPSGGVDWLIVDHYALDRRWEEKLRPHVSKIMVIDDLADRPHDCDLLLDQNLGRTPSDYSQLIKNTCSTLLGPQYALLRPEFAKWRSYSLNRRNPSRLTNVLINMGGVDKDNVTGKVLEAIKDCQLPVDCKITVVMGTTSPWLDSVSQLASVLPWDTAVKVGVTNMAQIMADSDLAIGAAGSTSWERCCIGLPTILLVIAENQIVAAKFLGESGSAIVLDQNWKKNELNKLLYNLVSLPGTITNMIKAGSEITDGNGVCLVCNLIAD